MTNFQYEKKNIRFCLTNLFFTIILHLYNNNRQPGAFKNMENLSLVNKKAAFDTVRRWIVICMAV
jgi:hypothetical protein